ncbi:hypothetical protein [Nocardioides sp. SYSU DS0663]|uniref:hypothetical protein n=1 Tax=Nocardioides sp. SYSU DS0663 TaxID=3416445 RepID=UPI003F4C4016
MSAEPLRTVEVVGGSHGLAASYARVRGLADAYDRAGEQLRAWSELGSRTMTDGELLESALLSPLTFAEAERAVAATTSGPDGLLVESVAWAADAVLVRVTVAAFEAADELVGATFEVVDHALGRAVGFTLGTVGPGVLAGLVVVGPAALALHRLLPPTLQHRLERDLREGAEELAADVEQWLVDHPEAVQHLVNGGGGLLDGLWDGLTPLAPGGPFGLPSFTPDTESAAGVLAGLYGDPGTGVAVPIDDPLGGRNGSDGPPAGLADVLAHLGRVAEHGGDGTIEVQSITGADGAVRHVVYLPGTDDMTTLPWTRDDAVRDLHTNFLLVSGADNAYQQGILDAMEQAGVGAEDPVLLVGHSQGGMAAAAILAGESGFTVTDVVTAGSPTAHVGAFPAGSHVLSLEHRGDVVPLLDGEDNADSPEQTTVRFDGDATGIADHHEMSHYVSLAEQLDAAGPGGPGSVTDALDRLRDQGYLATGPGTAVESRSYQVVREPSADR